MLLLGAGCSGGGDDRIASDRASFTLPPATDDGGNTPEPAGSTSVRVVSMVGTRATSSSAGSWSLEPGTRVFDVRVMLEGRGRATVRLTVVDGNGDRVHEDEQVHDLDGGPLELTFSDVGELTEPGRYTMTLRVVAPGVTQQSSVTVERP